MKKITFILLITIYSCADQSDFEDAAQRQREAFKEKQVKETESLLYKTGYMQGWIRGASNQSFDDNFPIDSAAIFK